VVGRLGLNSIHPVISLGEFPSRAVVGEHVPIEATVFREGHDAVAASVRWRSPAGVEAGFNRMHPLGGGTDRWRTEVVADTTGMWNFVIETWGDPLATWYHAIEVKVDAGQSADELANDLAIGAALFAKVALAVPEQAELATATAKDLRHTDVDVPLRITRALSREVRALAHDHPVRELITRSPRYQVWVDRERALYGAWYEFFPRSIGAQLANDPNDPPPPTPPGTVGRCHRSSRLRG